MRKLTLDEIKEFAERPNVKKVAVENFLISFPLDIGELANYQNVLMDSRLYKWNSNTIRVIKDGLHLAFKEE